MVLNNSKGSTNVIILRISSFLFCKRQKPEKRSNVRNWTTSLHWYLRVQCEIVNKLLATKTKFMMSSNSYYQFKLQINNVICDSTVGFLIQRKDCNIFSDFVLCLFGCSVLDHVVALCLQQRLDSIVSKNDTNHKFLVVKVETVQVNLDKLSTDMYH